MNTAALCDAFEKGARGASPKIEVKRVQVFALIPEHITGKCVHEA